MALFTTDFSEYTTGVFPSDWSYRWRNSTLWDAATVVVEEDSEIGGKGFKLDPKNGSYLRLISWDDIDADANRDDADVLALVKYGAANSSNETILIAARAAEPSLDDGYYFIVNNTDASIKRVANSTQVTLGSSSAGVTGAVLHSDFWWLRFRVNGTALKARSWKYGASEPASWHIEVTDATHSAAGWCGVGLKTDFVTYGLADYFSVGTNGDSPAGVNPVASTVPQSAMLLV